MTYKKPPRLNKEDLEHPNSSHYKSWNGDIRKNRTSRWNGSSDQEPGFDTRRQKSGMSVTHGTAKPSGRPVKAPICPSRPVGDTLHKGTVGAIQPIPKGHSFSPVPHTPQPANPSFDLEDLSRNQRAMLTERSQKKARKKA